MRDRNLDIEVMHYQPEDEDGNVLFAACVAILLMLPVAVVIWWVL